MPEWDRWKIPRVVMRDQVGSQERESRLAAPWSPKLPDLSHPPTCKKKKTLTGLVRRLPRRILAVVEHRNRPIDRMAQQSEHPPLVNRGKYALHSGDEPCRHHHIGQAALSQSEIVSPLYPPRLGRIDVDESLTGLIVQLEHQEGRIEIVPKHAPHLVG